MADLSFFREQIMELVEKSTDLDLLDLVYTILVGSQETFQEETEKLNRAV